MAAGRGSPVAGTHEEHRHRRASRHPVGNTAKDPSSECSTAVGGHGDQLDLAAGGVLHDLFRRVSSQRPPSAPAAARRAASPRLA